MPRAKTQDDASAGLQRSNGDDDNAEVDFSQDLSEGPTSSDQESEEDFETVDETRSPEADLDTDQEMIV